MTYKKRALALMNKYPAIVDLQKKARKRMPFVAQEYLETGTDNDETLLRNRKAFEEIRFKPKFLKGLMRSDLKVELFGTQYDLPFGIAPVGLTGLMWPNCEVFLAKAAKKYNIPYNLSTLATETPERVGPHVGEMGWFQLYTPMEKELTFKFLDRAKASGFKTLVITIDIPMPSRRQRTKRAGLQMPPKLSPYLLWQGITHPTWSIATLKRGLPKLRMVEAHQDFKDMMSVEKFGDGQVGGNLDWEYVKIIKEYWGGPVILKGIMHEEDALKAVAYGFDGIVVSNHGGRQFDGAPGAIEVLPEIAKAVAGKTKIIFDSGIRTGLDIIRALALGADFVLLGRAFIYSVSALGEIGPEHAIHILKEEIVNAMVNLGVESYEEIRALEPC